MASPSFYFLLFKKSTLSLCFPTYEPSKQAVSFSSLSPRFLPTHEPSSLELFIVECLKPYWRSVGWQLRTNEVKAVWGKKGDVFWCRDEKVMAIFMLRVKHTEAWGKKNKSWLTSWVKKIGVVACCRDNVAAEATKAVRSCCCWVGWSRVCWQGEDKRVVGCLNASFHGGVSCKSVACR